MLGDMNQPPFGPKLPKPSSIMDDGFPHKLFQPKAFFTIWAIGIILSLAVVGVVIWAIIRLVLAYT